MKSYTDLEQSKKLAEILPIESADMFYSYIVGTERYYENIPRFIQVNNHFTFFHYDIPCWSLAALLGVLESEIYGEEGKTYELNIEKDGTWWWIEYIERYGEANSIEPNSTEELLDACFEMILKLNEQKLL